MQHSSYLTYNSSAYPMFGINVSIKWIANVKRENNIRNAIAHADRKIMMNQNYRFQKCDSFAVVIPGGIYWQSVFFPVFYVFCAIVIVFTFTFQWGAIHVTFFFHPSQQIKRFQTKYLLHFIILQLNRIDNMCMNLLI